MFQEVLFLAEPVVPSSVAVVGGRGGCCAEEEGLVFYAFGELLGCAVWGVGA